MEKENYTDFFTNYENYKKIREEQKSRGLNDFNLLTTVLKNHDEVKLHSRMIAALLNPNGLHYQGTLFLKLFLKEIELEKWFKNLDSVSVYKEHENIDLYLTDGNKHLIIENKIWAGDQPCQIMRYINIIVNNNQEQFKGHISNSIITKDKMRVIYLTPRAKKIPSQHKLEKIGGENYIVIENDIVLKNCSPDLKSYKAYFQKITYNDTVLPWLKESQRKIRNITNLRESIGQYISVVKDIHNNYELNVTNFFQYIQEQDNKKLITKCLFEIDLKKEPSDTLKELVKTKGEMLYRFFRSFDLCLEKYNLENVNYLVGNNKKQKKLIYNKGKCNKRFKVTGNKYYNFGTFYKIDENYLLYIFIGRSRYIHFGLIKHTNYMIKPMSSNPSKYKLELRNWKSIESWYSKEFDLFTNLDILYNISDSEFLKELYSLLDIYLAKP